MRLHVKSCPYCKRCAIKLDGEKQWHRSMVDIPVDRLRELHEVVTETQEDCYSCAIKIFPIPLAAGMVH